jgi:hypothetical protein
MSNQASLTQINAVLLLTIAAAASVLFAAKQISNATAAPIATVDSPSPASAAKCPQINFTASGLAAG